MKDPYLIRVDCKPLREPNNYDYLALPQGTPKSVTVRNTDTDESPLVLDVFSHTGRLLGTLYKGETKTFRNE